jgi:hypothetical protein
MDQILRDQNGPPASAAPSIEVDRLPGGAAWHDRSRAEQVERCAAIHGITVNPSVASGASHEQGDAAIHGLGHPEADYSCCTEYFSGASSATSPSAGGGRPVT